MEIDEIIERLEGLHRFNALLRKEDVKAIIAAVEQLKKERWISVNDRLPSREELLEDETEYVLVKLKHDFDDGYSESICGYTKDGWSEWDSFGSVRPEEITHWKPLYEKWK